MSEQRLIDLETKFSHQDLNIEALQQTVYEHQKTIDKLVAKLEKLAIQLEAGKNDWLDIGPADERPPHY